MLVNYTRGFFAVMATLALVLLDTSLFSFIRIYDSTIISSFIILIVFALLGHSFYLKIMIPAAIIALAALSSLPLWVIAFAFFLLPGIVLFLRQTYVPEPTVIVTITALLLTTFLFQSALLVSDLRFVAGAGLTTAYFIFLNTVVGTVVFAANQRLRQKWMRGEIKL